MIFVLWIRIKSRKSVRFNHILDHALNLSYNLLIPAHCGHSGNETAEFLVKQGASKKQLDKSTTYTGEKVKIKTYHKTT